MDAPSAYWLSALVAYDPPSMQVRLHDDIASMFESLVAGKAADALPAASVA